MHKAVGLAVAVEKIPDGASLLIGGFMGVGSPHRLIGELIRQGRKNLTVIANDTARPGFGIGRLIDAKAVNQLVVSHIGTNPETQRQMIAQRDRGRTVPAGNARRAHSGRGLRSGWRSDAHGVGTIVSEKAREIDVLGKRFLLELPISADFALLAAHRADYYGNLDYALTARNFNPIMAMAGIIVIAERAEIVPVGVIPPDEVVTPSVLVDYLVARGKVNGR